MDYLVFIQLFVAMLLFFSQTTQYHGFEHLC